MHKKHSAAAAQPPGCIWRGTQRDWGHHRPQQLLDSVASQGLEQSHKEGSTCSMALTANLDIVSFPHSLVHLKPVLPLLSFSQLTSSCPIPAHNKSSQAKKGQTGTHGVATTPSEGQMDAELQTHQHSPQPKLNMHTSNPACNLLTSSEQEGMELRSLVTLVKNHCFSFLEERQNNPFELSNWGRTDICSDSTAWVSLFQLQLFPSGWERSLAFIQRHCLYTGPFSRGSQGTLQTFN